MNTLGQHENLDTLWPELEMAAKAGRLSDKAMAHLLALADELSIQRPFHNSTTAYFGILSRLRYPLEQGHRANQRPSAALF